MNCCFLQNELGLFHLFEENTTLHEISKFKKNFLLLRFQIFRFIDYNNLILGISLEACRYSVCLLFHYSFIFKATLRRFTVTLFSYHRNSAYILWSVVTLLK